MSRTTNTLMTNIDVQLAELKKQLEQQKNAEEQERLRKIQVCSVVVSVGIRKGYACIK